MSIIERNFQNCCSTPSDINQLLPIIKSYADNCEIVTELGVRNVVSTWALLASKANKVISYDINYNQYIAGCGKICGQEGRNWQFILDSSLSCDIETTDLLFIDTFHTYSQLKAELERHNKQVKKYILMHDVSVFSRISENGMTKGLLDAIEEFVKFNNNWKVKEFYTQNNGLMILERII